MKTRAIVFRRLNEPAIEQIDLPEIGPGDVRVRTHYSGLSIGTESSIYSGRRTHNGTFPMVTGYMSTGVVEEVGSKVSDFKPGDSVVVNPSKLDGPVNSIWGAHMAMRVASADCVYRLPENVDPVEASMFVMPRVGLNAANMCGVGPEDVAIVIGQGLIGQFFGQFARLRGARTIAIEKNPLRIELAKKYVTPDVLNPDECDVAARVNELAGDDHRVVVEATGVEGPLEMAASLFTPKCSMVYLAWHAGRISIDFNTYHANEVTSWYPMGSGGRETGIEVLDRLGDGSIKMTDNITDVLDVNDAPAGFRRIIEGDPNVMGMVFDWRDA